MVKVGNSYFTVSQLYSFIEFLYKDHPSFTERDNGFSIRKRDDREFHYYLNINGLLCIRYEGWVNSIISDDSQIEYSNILIPEVLVDDLTMISKIRDWKINLILE